MIGFIRAKARASNQLRPVRITRGYTVHAEGSVGASFPERPPLAAGGEFWGDVSQKGGPG